MGTCGVSGCPVPGGLACGWPAIRLRPDGAGFQTKHFHQQQQQVAAQAWPGDVTNGAFPAFPTCTCHVGRLGGLQAFCPSPGPWLVHGWAEL